MTQEPFVYVPFEALRTPPRPVQLKLSLTQEESDLLTRLAEKHGVSQQVFVRNAVAYLLENEDV